MSLSADCKRSSRQPSIGSNAGAFYIKRTTLEWGNHNRLTRRFTEATLVKFIPVHDLHNPTHLE